MAGLIRIQTELKESHKYELSSKDIVSHVVNNLRFEYDPFTNDMRYESDEGNDVELKDLTEAMNKAYKLYWKRKGKDPRKVASKYSFDQVEEKKNDDVSFNTQSKGKGRKFKGTCNKFGRQGHKAVDCWEDKKSKAKRLAGWKSVLNNNAALNSNDAPLTCKICGKPGHKLENCFHNPLNPRNKLKDPELVNTTKDQESDHDDESTLDVLCNVLSFARGSNNLLVHTGDAYKCVKSVDLGLYFPGMSNVEIRENVWIADSGVSTHMFVGNKGFVESKNSNDSVQVGEGTTIVCMKIGKWRGFTTNSDNKKPMGLKLGNTMHVPQFKVNLFLLTKSMDNRKDFFSKEGKIIL